MHIILSNRPDCWAVVVVCSLPFRPCASVNGLAATTDVKIVCHKHRNCALVCVLASAWLGLASIRTLCHRYCTVLLTVSPGCDASACAGLNCLTLHIAFHIVNTCNDLCDALQYELFPHHRYFSSIVHHLS